MAVISITRGREIITGKERFYRGIGTWSTTDTTGTLTIPKGNIVGFTATDVKVSSSAPVAYAADAIPTNGVIACTGSLPIKRAASGESGGKFFFRVDYDS